MGLGLLALLILIPLSLSTLGQSLENLALDRCYRIRPAGQPPPEILIIGIDEASFQELRKAWPWPRRLHAELIRRLAAAGARTIVFDVTFSDPTNPEDDRALAEAIRQAGNVILAETFEVTEDPGFFRRILVKPLAPFIKAAQGLGLSMITPDPDGVVRRFRLRLGGQDTLPAAVIRRIPSPPPIPQDLSGLINYVGPPRQMDTVSYYQVLDLERPLPSERIRNRIVLIGRMAGVSVSPQGQTDSFYTPFFAGNGQTMSGVEIQGNIIYTLMRHSWGNELPAAPRIIIYLILLLLLSYALARLHALAGLVLLAGVTLLLGLGSLLLFLSINFWAPPVLLIGGLVFIYMGNVLAHYLIESKEKRWLRHAFSRYVSPSLVQAIIAHPEGLKLGGEEVEVTVLFADLSGFTTISEKLPPQVLIGILNEYFAPMTRIILSQQGTLDKYIGDSIMALWGAPVPMADHAFRACQAALEMQRQMPALERDWQARGLSSLSSRIGMHSGSVLAGNVGSGDRFNYTVLGDTVNLASRLEGVNKIYGTEILISEMTYRLVGEAFLVRELDKVQVRGRSQPVTIYELLDLTQDRPDWLEFFKAGREAYLQKNWDQAVREFEKVLSLKADDPPARLFLDRCRSYLKHPPPDDWQGIYVLKNK